MITRKAEYYNLEIDLRADAVMATMQKGRFAFSEGKNNLSYSGACLCWDRISEIFVPKLGGWSVLIIF